MACPVPRQDALERDASRQRHSKYFRRHDFHQCRDIRCAQTHGRVYGASRTTFAPMNLNEITLGTLPKHLKQLAMWLLLVLAFGYSQGLAFVYFTTGISPHGVEERYRGNQTQQTDSAAPTEMKFEKSPAEMLNIVHTHVIGMCTMFAISSVIFAFSTSCTGFWKKFLLLEPF